MERLPSTKPYLLRAIWEWCCDNNLTPHIAVVVDKRTRVPREFVKDGQIVLNLGPGATNKLNIGNEYVEFQARFGGVARELSVPVEQVAAIYARENGAGMAFDLDEEAQLAGDMEDAAVADSEPDPQPPRPEPGRPKLQRIK
ncbi:MAG: ClpXP protease specificity-enhancing factor [Rhodocyclaceae bacterium]|nr:ClpXP protease specificity-enhancing factor [Rhodocyclaceae bacterium]